MSAEARLAEALNQVIAEGLDRGLGFIWLPELVTPTPVAEMLGTLLDRGGVRVGIFVDGYDTADIRGTTDVATVVDWRNDSSVRDAIVIIGNLERDRASGLGDIRPIKLSDVRRRLFGALIQELRVDGVPQPAIRLLKVLAETDSLVDLIGCSRYCESLLPIGPATAQQTKLQLWHLGLLPDASATEIDRRRLQQNSQVVSRLRSMDASTRQRLIRHLNETGVGQTDYAVLRRFASTGDSQHLAGLDLEHVQVALRSTGQAAPKGKKASEPTSFVNGLVDALAEDSFDEIGFVSQVSRNPGDPVPGDRSITVGPSKLDWDFQSLESVSQLLGDPDDEAGYEAQAGSMEVIRAEEPFPQPGKGVVEWRSLVEIAEQLRRLETRAHSPGASSAEIIESLIAHRRALLPALESIPTEGVRLFLLSAQLRSAATALIGTWVALWQSMKALRDRLSPEDHVYVRRMAERLASADLRITRHGADVEAYVLPLHPIMLEPRVRAAELFLEDDDVSDDFFELVVGSLDPAVPSLSILVDGAPVSLGYAGEFKGLLHYAKSPRQVDSSDVDRTIREIVQRFVNVHPYASLSLSVGLLDPPPKTAKALLRWLGEHGADRVSLRAFTTRWDGDDVRAALDEAKDELVSGEISAAAFDFDVIPVRDFGAFPRALAEGEQLPHLLFTFDLGDVEQSSSGFKFSTPPLGSLVSEWMFDTDPLEHARPVIRPRSGSNQLTEFLTSQAGLFEMPLPSQQRSPLLSRGTEQAIERLADLATWVVLCEGVSALVPPTKMGQLQLVGRMGSGSHVAFVYSSHVALLLEPVVRYLWNVVWIDPDRDAVLQFLLGTIRTALPEGLLGFFKARGALAKESVLGRLGFAAALAFLEEQGDGHQLIVSLDTEGARRWLGLREGKERRADLLLFKLRTDGVWDLEAIEVKARTESTSWANSPPESVVTALEQVKEMQRLLNEIFERKKGDPFTPSRREILKRQVFLEAFQQWEPVRLTEERRYADQITRLNEMFTGKVGEIRRRVLLISPSYEGEAVERQVDDDDGVTPVVTLGVPWLRRAIEAQPGGVIEIPAALLDEVGLDFPAWPAAGQVGSDSGATISSELTTGPVVELQDAADSAVVSDEPEVDDDVSGLAQRLRDVFVARSAPFRSIESDQIVRGPTVIQIPFTVPVGAKLAQLASQAEDIARDLGVQSVRISNWSGRPGYAVAELPRRRRDIPDVSHLELPDEFRGYPSVALGAQLDYSPSWVSLDELPHLLVAGTTGSGKSIFLRSLLWQVTRLYKPADLDLVVIDAKGMADYLDFGEAPHIKSPEDFHSGVPGALELLEDIVDRRLSERTALFRAYATEALRRKVPAQITNLRQLLADSNHSGDPPPIRPLVVVIDEFAELVLATAERKRFEAAVTRFVGIARAIGGHLVAATQRPSTDVVTGVMKANFARVALRVQQSVDSRVILDENGAETLLGRGDLLFKSANVGLLRLQGFSAIGPYLSQ